MSPLLDMLSSQTTYGCLLWKMFPTEYLVETEKNLEKPQKINVDQPKRLRHVLETCLW
jgi:hypothetical protein